MTNIARPRREATGGFPIAGGGLAVVVVQRVVQGDQGGEAPDHLGDIADLVGRQAAADECFFVNAQN